MKFLKVKELRIAMEIWNLFLISVKFFMQKECLNNVKKIKASLKWLLSDLSPNLMLITVTSEDIEQNQS